MTRITSKKNFPKKAHWVILEFRSISIPYDDDTTTEDVCEYLAFDSRDEWLVEVEKRATGDLKRRGYGYDKEWVAFEAGKPVEIGVKVTVT